MRAMMKVSVVSWSTASCEQGTVLRLQHSCRVPTKADVRWSGLIPAIKAEA